MTAPLSRTARPRRPAGLARRAARLRRPGGRPASTSARWCSAPSGTWPIYPASSTSASTASCCSSWSAATSSRCRWNGTARLRRFWIGRLCRIYPAYLAAVALFALVCAAGWLRWPRPAAGRNGHRRPGARHACCTDLLGLRGAVRVFWTLSYEMTFYLVVAGLFAWRLHRLSAWWAAGLGARPPCWPARSCRTACSAARRRPAGSRPPSCVLVLVAVPGRVPAATGSCPARRRRRHRRSCCSRAVNGHATGASTVISSWQGLLLLAVMFAGTVVYRAQHGQLGRRAATSP